eukprot:Pgem_evm1s18549
MVKIKTSIFNIIIIAVGLYLVLAWMIFKLEIVTIFHYTNDNSRKDNSIITHVYLNDSEDEGHTNKKNKIDTRKLVKNNVRGTNTGFSESITDYTRSEICNSPTLFDLWAENKDNNNFRLSPKTPLCKGHVYNYFHIIVPFYNLKKTILKQSYDSFTNQNYPQDRFFIWFVDDGSNDPKAKEALIEYCNERNSPKVNSMIHNWPQFEKIETTTQQTQCLFLPNNLGPAGAKFVAFKHIAKVASPNDIVVVVDGDDELHNPEALNIINSKYINTKAWVTYGSFSGKYQEQTQPLPNVAVADYAPRTEQPTNSWRYGHPRTFKNGLAEKFVKEDFLDRNGVWLKKATDRAYFYKVLELAGKDRIEYITSRIYKYKPGTSSTMSTVPLVEKRSNLQDVLNQNKQARMELPIHIVLVCHSRMYLLPLQLKWLQEQSLAKQGRKIVVHLLNNNWEKEAVKELETNVHTFQTTQNHLDNNMTPIEVITSTNLNPVEHAFSRFVYVHELKKTTMIDNVIFVDDDQYFPVRFLESTMKKAKPNGAAMWYGKTFKCSKNEYGNYWRSLIGNAEETHAQRNSHLTSFTYGGPGGSIFPANLWLMNDMLLRLKDDSYLKQYINFDDIWVSYLMNGVLGWSLERLTQNLPYDLSWSRAKQFLPNGFAIRKIKKQLIQSGTYSKSIKIKEKTFMDFQQKYFWDVCNQY